MEIERGYTSQSNFLSLFLSPECQSAPSILLSLQKADSFRLSSDLQTWGECPHPQPLRLSLDPLLDNVLSHEAVPCHPSTTTNL
jgi:hypothetical protein